MLKTITCFPFSKKITKNPPEGYPANFQIEWDGIVVDIDFEIESLVWLVQKLFGRTKIVKTPHGYHLYYHTSDKFPKRIWLELEKIKNFLSEEEYQILKNHTKIQKIQKSTGKFIVPIELKKRVMQPGSLYSPALEKKARERQPIQLEEIKEAFRYYVLQEHKIPTITYQEVQEAVKEIIEQEEIKKEEPKQKKTSSPFVYSCPSRMAKRVSYRLSEYVGSLVRSFGNDLSDWQASYWDESVLETAVAKLVGRVTPGKGVLCHLHRERKPSAAFYKTVHGLRYFEFHPRGSLSSLSMPEFLNAYVHKIHRASSNGDGLYVLGVKTALATAKQTLPEQYSSAQALFKLADELEKSLTKIPHIVQQLIILIRTYAKYTLISFGPDIFSVRFGAQLTGMSKSKVAVLLKLLRDAGILIVEGTKELGNVKPAYVYSVGFSSLNAASKALRLLWILGMLPTGRGWKNVGKPFSGGSVAHADNVSCSRELHYQVGPPIS